MSDDQPEPATMLEPDRMGLRLPLIWGLIGLIVSATIGATLFYASVNNNNERFWKAIQVLEETLDEGLKDVKGSVDKVDENLRAMSRDTIMTRQGQTWIEMQRAANKAKYPDLIWMDLPR